MFPPLIGGRLSDLTPPPDSRKIVLVVDDEPMIRMALADHLETKGFEVREAGNAAEAVAILQEPGCIVNLVFSDVRMPGEMDGLGLSRWIFENRPSIPVILASGDLGKTTAMDDPCGAETMAKPYSYETASDKILAAINRKALKP